MLLKLPNELLLQIAEYLEVDELHFWILTAKRFYLSLDDALYTKAVTLDRLEFDWPQYLMGTIVSNRLSGFKRLLEKTALDDAKSQFVRRRMFSDEMLCYPLPIQQEMRGLNNPRRKRSPYTTLLHLACFLDRHEMARLIIEKGVSPSMIDTTTSPLSIASSINSLSLMKLLIVEGAIISACGNAPLCYASRNGNVAAVQLLLNAGADVLAKNERDCSPLHLAAGSPNSVQVARLLIQAGADISRRMNCIGTPLHSATRKGDIGMTKLLLEHGADVTALDWYGETVLHGVRSLSIAKLLISVDDSLVSVVNHVGSTPLRSLVQDWRPSDPIEELESVALFLIEAGVSLTTIVQTGPTVDFIHKLAEYGCDKTVKAVLRIDPSLARIRDFRGMTPLHYAAEATSEGMVGCVKHLIEAGGEINALTDNGETALHYVVKGEQPHIQSVLQLLLHAGVSISAQTIYGETALHEALFSNNPNIALDLIEAGIDVSPKITYQRGISSTYRFCQLSDAAWAEMHSPGSTALHCAARFGYFDVVKRLVECHIDISATDVHRNTALHLAVREGVNRNHSVEGYVNMMALILLGSHNVSVSEVNGQTSLHGLLSGGYIAIVRHLLASGADVTARNSCDCSALDIVSRRGWRRVPYATLNHSEEIKKQLGEKPSPGVLRWLGMVDEKELAELESLEDLFGDATF